MGKYKANAGSRSRVGRGVRTKSLVQLPEITENHDDSGCMVKKKASLAMKENGVEVGWKSED